MKRLIKLEKDSTDRTPNGFLATLLRRVLRQIGIENVPSLIAKFNKFSELNNADLKVSSSTLQDLYKDKITFNSFIRILLNLLRPVSLKITIEIDMGKDRKIIESIEIKKKKRKEE